MACGNITYRGNIKLGEDYLKIREEIKSRPITNDVIQDLYKRCVIHQHSRSISGTAISKSGEVHEFIEEIKSS